MKNSGYLSDNFGKGIGEQVFVIYHRQRKQYECLKSCLFMDFISGSESINVTGIDLITAGKPNPNSLIFLTGKTKVTLVQQQFIAIYQRSTLKLCFDRCSEILLTDVLRGLALLMAHFACRF